MTDIFAKLAAPFPKEKIHWRAQSVAQNGPNAGKSAMALAYLDARDVMNRLDEVCFPQGWQCEHYDAGGGKMACKIGILFDNVGWVWKSDGAGETQVEAEKGAFSGALKRAAVAWGIGRYLYDLPAPWVPCECRESNGKFYFKKWKDDPWNHCSEAIPGGVSPTDFSGADKIKTSRPDGFIPVPDIEDEKERWDKWGKAFKAAARKATAPTELDQIWTANDAPLKNLGIFSEKAYDHMHNFVEQQKATLLEKAGLGPTGAG